MLALAVALPALAAKDLRLAGTVTGGKGDWLAMVELPSGAQQLVRAGDRLADGVIVSIGDRVVRVRYATGDKVYVLEAGQTIATWEGRPTPGPVPGPPIVMSRKVAPDLPKKLAEVETRYSGGDPATLRAELNKALGLPAGAQIQSVDRSNVGSDVAAIRKVRSALAAKRIPHLFLTGSKELNEVYLFPPGLAPPAAPPPPP